MTIRDVHISYEQISKVVNSRESSMSVIEEYAQTPTSQDHVLDKSFNQGSQAVMLAGFSKALEELENAERIRGKHIFTVVDHNVASLLQSYLAERANADGKIVLGRTGLREVKFDDKDYLGWVKSFFSWWRGLNKHAWIAPPAAPDLIPGKFRLALLGDWGTGLYAAPVSARTIENDPKKYNLIVHLGDVYYAGMEKEVQDRFLDLWPKIPGAISRAVNSNHEMYTGGHAYFNLTLPAFGQTSSCFALQNDHWLLVGLDSAYRNPNHAGFTDDQIQWLRDLVQRSGKRKIVLFSHHQLFSWIDEVNDNLSHQLDEFLSSGKIFAWYWGHEHRCIIYDKYEKWRLYGRCVGHSGYPYFRDQLLQEEGSVAMKIAGVSWYRLDSLPVAPGCLILDGTNQYVADDSENYGPQGFLSLEFDGEDIKEIVHLPDGESIYEGMLK